MRFSLALVVLTCLSLCLFFFFRDGKLKWRPVADRPLALLCDWLLGYGGVDSQLSIIHQGAGEAGQVQVSGQLNLPGEAHLRGGRGAEGGAGGGWGARLALLGTRLLHGNHGKAPPLKLNCDVVRGIATSIYGHQEVAVVFCRLLDVQAVTVSLLLVSLRQSGGQEARVLISSMV